MAQQALQFTCTEKDRVDEMYTDMYKGKDLDNPSVTTRLDRLEISMNQIQSSRNENRVWFMGILATIIATLILMHLKIF